MKSVTRGVLSSPERVLWPDINFTKQDLLDYYEAVWPWMEPHVVNRPIALLRCPQGIEEDCFFQKRATQSSPAGIRTVALDEANAAAPIIDDFAGLAGLVQLSALELHLWSAPASDIEHPDQLIFDLDPDPGVPWASVIEATLLVRQFVEKIGLVAFAKTSGGKGIHVVAPLDGSTGWEEIRQFAHGFSSQLAREHPHLLTARAAKEDRAGRIFLDYLRNGRGTTSIATFCPRARKGAPIAAPVSWEEVEAKVKPNAFNVLNMKERLETLPRNPWDGFDEARRSLPDIDFNWRE